MSNSFNDFLFEEMKRLSKISDDELVEEYKVARTIAEKRNLPSDWSLFETVEHEVNRRNRKTGGNSTWWKLVDDKTTE